MRFLFDQNLSPHLKDVLDDLYPQIVHVRDVGLQAADDDAVWAYAAQNGLTIVSKDADFRQRSFLFGPPPKVVWIRRGNSSTAEVEAILRARHDDLVSFLQDEEGSFLALTQGISMSPANKPSRSEAIRRPLCNDWLVAEY